MHSKYILNSNGKEHNLALNLLIFSFFYSLIPDSHCSGLIPIFQDFYYFLMLNYWCTPIEHWVSSVNSHLKSCFENSRIYWCALLWNYIHPILSSPVNSSSHNLTLHFGRLVQQCQGKPSSDKKLRFNDCCLLDPVDCPFLYSSIDNTNFSIDYDIGN